jgi:anaerobic magnesium-protoporphyrin IX monomethyl ester cyclase
MKIVLTHGYFLCEDEVEQKIMMPFPPLGLLYLSAYLDQFNIEHEVIDSTFSNEEEWIGMMKDKAPDIIGFYANMLTKVKIIRLIGILKSIPALSSTKMVLGGPDVTFNIENYMNNGADFLIIGEGEETFFELISQFSTSKDYKLVKGIVFKDSNKQIVKNPPREFIGKLDEIPFPNRRKIEIDAYLNTWKKYHGKTVLNISTQRGCTYSCKWCSKAVYGISYRRTDPSIVVDEIETLINEYHPDELWFVDDVFTANHKWVQALCEEMSKRRVFIPFECITRAERLNPEILKQMKSVGCKRIWIGAESGSQKVLNLMNRETDIQRVTETIQLVKGCGIEAGSFIMLGYPGEKMDDIRQTIQFLKKADPDHFTITLTYPISGTELYEQVKKEILNQGNWQTTIDRQIDYKRSYSPSFYNDAIRLVTNEVYYHREKRKGNKFSQKAITYFLKAKVSALKCELKSLF